MLLMRERPKLKVATLDKRLLGGDEFDIIINYQIIQKYIKKIGLSI